MKKKQGTMVNIKGMIMPPHALIPRWNMGSAAIKVGGKPYHLELAATERWEPFILCRETGKGFYLTWEVLIEMAINAGAFNDEAKNRKIEE